MNLQTKQELEEFLFEIGTEELPVSYVQAGSRSEDEGENQGFRFQERFEEVFRKARISFEELSIWVTPRRIIFSAKLARRQTAEKVTVRGPSFDKAFDSDGQPTQALKGFLASRGAQAAEVRRLETEKGVYASLEIEQKSEATQTLLEPVLLQLIASLPFPKRMRWENPEGFFPRPIRWLVLLFGKKVIPMRYGTVKASNQTMGHRFLFNKQLLIKDPNIKRYQHLLMKAHVILDQIYPVSSETHREKIILKQVKQKLSSTKLDYSRIDFDLVKDIANLVEEPNAFLGDFNKEHLSLPQEVLSASMKKHQRVLACYDKKGHIQNHFVGVTNGGRSAVAMKQIRRNFENVLEAKLRDAAFFHHEDSRLPLSEKVAKLKNIVFLGKLGSVYDKTERLVAYAEKFSSEKALSLTDREKADLIRAAYLAKADLVTQMVYEFPELQGVMGRHYALLEGETKGVGEAIMEHYWPRFRGDILPKTKTGAMLAIFDKIDTFCGAFASGFTPSGSQDPYALRRAVMGVVRILKEMQFDVSVSDFLSFGLSLYKNRVNFEYDKVLASLRAFFKERLEFVFEETFSEPGERAILGAVIRSSFERLADLEKRATLLSAVLKADPDIFQKAAKVCERTFNILKNNEEPLTGEISPDLLEQPVEKKLYEAYKNFTVRINSACDAGKYDKALHEYGEGFYDPINAFFDQVMVNVEDAAVRQNRKKLLSRIYTLFADRIADLSLVRF